METEVRTTKTSEKRSYAKFLVLILVVAICFLLFMLHKASDVNKRLVRRKSFLLDRLRTSKEAEENTLSKLKEMTLELEERKKQVDTITKQKEESEKKAQDLTNSYNEKVTELEAARKTAVSCRK